MEQLFEKTPRLTAYNLVAKGIIFGQADISYADNGRCAFVELYTYQPQMQQSGLIGTDQEEWNDFRELEDLTALNEPLALIRDMLRTMIRDFGSCSGDIGIEKRKEVFDLSVSKGNESYALVMLHDLQPFVTGNRQRAPAVFVHDPEEFDLWRFDSGTPDQAIVADVLTALR